jgi:Cu2+-exporting ATPase
MTIETDILTPVEVRCAHCNLPVPAGLIEPEASQQFCCGGCRAVYEAVHACGLDSYYRLRDAADATLAPAHPSESKFESFDSDKFHELYVTRSPDGTIATTDLVLEGVTCAACVWLVEKLPRVVEGVIEARLSLREAVVRITWDPERVSLSRIARVLNGFGYTPHPARGMDARELHRRESRRRLVHLGIAGAIVGNTMLLAAALYAGDAGHMEAQYRMFFRWISALLGTLALAWPGAVFFRSAISAIRARTTNLDIPIALALLAGGIAGLTNVILNRGEIYFDSLTVLVFLLLVGRFIQYRQQRRADDAVGLLFSMTPTTCHLVRGGVVVDAQIEALGVDEIVEVSPGELFPADGIVESGQSTVNQSLLTGESMPAAVQPGSIVHAGSQNIAQTLRVLVSKVGRDTRLAQLVALIERGVQDKPPIVQFADQVGGWFIIAVTLAAAGTFAYWSKYSVVAAIDHTVALLIVTCPCVLGLATPLTIAIAIGKLARRQILVKSGVAIERLSRGGELLLDKTGTLTEGKLELLIWAGDESAKPIVAELERKSNHPVGRALCDALESFVDAPTVTDIIERGDGGLSGHANGSLWHIGSPRYVSKHRIQIADELAHAISAMQELAGSPVIVARDGIAVAVAGLGDRVWEDSSAALRALTRQGWNASILSGDAKPVVASVAQHVGVDPECAFGEMSPEEKLDRVHIKHQQHDTVVMVGDGVNDSAALAAADVGIAVHGGAEASLAAADVYIARPGLSPLVELVQTSRLAMRTIRRNLLVSLSYNLLAGTLAAMGIMTPLIAAIIMPLSSATVLSLAVASIGRDTKPPARRS